MMLIDNEHSQEIAGMVLVIKKITLPKLYTASGLCLENMTIGSRPDVRVT